MAFPTTPILDTFDRANGALGSNWTSPVTSGDVSPTILTNTAICTNGSFGSAAWAAIFGPDLEAYCTVAITAGGKVAFSLRGSGSAGTETDYFVSFDPSAGVDISRTINGSNSGSLRNIAVNVANGWKVGVRTLNVVANVSLEAWADKIDGNGWVLLGSYLDTAAPGSLLDAGFIGFRQFGSGAIDRSVNDFGGGTFIAPTIRPVMGRGATW